FAGSWIANPHQFRDGTRMPQVFHLENGVSKEWDDTSIAAVREYLWDRSEQQDVPKMPADLRVAADAARGEALFQQAGCLACHEGAGADGHDYSKFGPDLTGIGSKLSEDWLYQWVYDPQAWWPETRMPNLRLEPQEAADIAVYLSERKAADWTPIAVDHDPALLEEQALAFLQARRTLDESRQTLEQWRSEGGEPRVLAEVGKQWILRQGCYSCHDIPGFEQGMPIGTELSDWGNKNVHKLAFERWSKATPGHFDGAREPSRFAFAELKLSNPRRFDLGLEVAPMDKLRMPDFKLTPHEVEAITTVLLGLKDEAAYILPDARPQPNADQTVLEKGAFLVRQKNCYGCHKFDMDKVTATIEFGDGTLTKSFHGLVTLQDDDEEATYMQLWKADPDLAIEQGSGQVGEVAELLWENNADEAWPVEKGRGGGIMAGLAEYYVETGEVDDATEAFPLLPPILYREGEKVRAPWLTQFLLAPYTLRPWMVVRMPRFSLTEDEARAIALYFAALSRKEWDGRYTRALRLSEEMVLADFAAATGVDARILQAIESGGRYSANSFGKVVEYGTARSFSFAPPPDLPFEEIHERSPVYLAEKDAEIEGYLEKGGELIGPQGVNCYACHIRDGQAPGGDKLSWAPDLAYAKDRLRPDWILAWVTDAQKIYPGTKMPTALGLVEDPKLQEIMPGEPLQLLEAIRDYLLNSDRVRAVGDPLSMAAPGSGGR
ncbi:MAG TPA: c-type cytochrome, partial [Planctomycetota bacterium]